MLREKVESSSIVSVGYNSANRILEVEFVGGAVYAYHEVARDVYERLMTAESKGRFVNYEIKPNYEFTRK